jgi:hypothetical protein
MEITLDKLSDGIMSIVRERVKFTPENSQEIGRRIGIDISSRIVSGEAQPPSKKTFDRHGRRSNNPTLWETGEYASNFTGEFVKDDEMWIVNRSHVSPRWKVILERTLSVFNIDTLKTILKEGLNANR